MSLFFITGNAGKFAEIKSLLPEVEQLDIDLEEIQSNDSQVVIEHKLQEAQAHHEGEFIVEDVSVSLTELNGLPGPLIKWFLKSLGVQGLAKLAAKLPSQAAEAKTTIGYSDADGNIEFFEGVVEGEIVLPQGDNGFGWDPIFKPKGHKKTFGEMELAEKETMSMRKIAVEKLSEYLNSKN